MNNVINNGLDIFNPEEDKDDYPIESLASGENNPNLAKSNPSTNQAAEKTKTKVPLTYDQWLKDSGLSNIPELEGYTDERREKRAVYQQNMFNLAQGLRSVMQGISGSQGSYMSKFEADKTTPRVQAELARIRNANDANERKVKLANWSRKLKNAELFNNYSNKQEDLGRADERLDKQLDIQDKRIADQRGYEETLYERNRKDKLSDVQQLHENRIEIEGVKGDNNASLQSQRLAGIRAKDKLKKDEAEKKKIVLTVKEKDGTETNLSALEVEELAYPYLEEARKLYKENYTEFFEKYPISVQNYIAEGKELSDSQRKDIVRGLYSIPEQSSDMVGGKYTQMPKSKTGKGKYTSGSK